MFRHRVLGLLPRHRGHVSGSIRSLVADLTSCHVWMGRNGAQIRPRKDSDSNFPTQRTKYHIWKYVLEAHLVAPGADRMLPNLGLKLARHDTRIERTNH
jgi:hypothetical protein